MSVAEWCDKLNSSAGVDSLQMNWNWKRNQNQNHYSESMLRHAEYLKERLTHLVIRNISFNIIIMGPHGCGKNTFFESCVANLDIHRTFSVRCRIIRLNGFLCGKNWKTSINEIFRQLKVKEHEDLLGGDDVGNGKSFDNRFEMVLGLLRSKLNESGATINSMMYIFLLDKLEYFCGEVQHLLYNLLDACGSHHQDNRCLGVIGITSRVDIVEMFEKRVKSRFSHRILNLAGDQSFSDYLKVASSLTRLDNKPKWNTRMTEIMKNPQIQRILQMLYDTNKSISHLSLFLYETALISKDITDIANGMIMTWTKFSSSSKVQQCLDLTVLDMLLILAIKLVYPDPFQFDTLWKQIEKLAAQHKLERGAMKQSFLLLESLELIEPIKERGKLKKESENTFYRSNIGFNDVTTALSTYPYLPTSFQEYASLPR